MKSRNPDNDGTWWISHDHGDCPVSGKLIHVDRWQGKDWAFAPFEAAAPQKGGG